MTSFEVPKLLSFFLVIFFGGHLEQKGEKEKK